MTEKIRVRRAPGEHHPKLPWIASIPILGVPLASQCWAGVSAAEVIDMALADLAPGSLEPDPCEAAGRNGSNQDA